MSAQDHSATTGLPTLGNDPLNGSVVDGITLERRLSESGTARIYLGRDGEGQPLRVWIAADHLAADVAFVARLRQEAGLLATLRHVNVETCRGHRSWTTGDGRPLLALVEEVTPGLPLSELVRREPLPVRDVLRLFHQACAGLAAAHRMGIVHGDFTPDAILVTTGGAAKVRAFALGVSGYSAERAERSLVGSPDFMAPEVGRGQQPSPLSDLYAIGASLSAVLIGEAPFPGASALETIHRHGTTPVPELSATHPEFAPVAPLIGRLLAKDPAQRWMEVEELSRELLVLSGQFAGEVRCRPWSGRRPLPLAALVQAELAQRQPERPPEVNERSSGGTTSISRKSVEFFRNPERFKPPGLTPAQGLPVLPPKADGVPTTRVVRRPEPVVASPSPAVAAPPKTASYLSHLAAAKPATEAAAVPVTPAKPSPRWLLPLGLLLLLGAAGSAVVLLRPAAAIPSPAPLVSAPVVSPTIPAAESLMQRIDGIIALALRDPAQALEQAASLRREQPTAELARLPVPLRLVVEGPEASAVQVTDGSGVVAVAPGLLLARPAGVPWSLRLSAAGFRPQEVVVPASAESDEVVQPVVMLDAPRWSLPEFAPAWVRLLPSAHGILVASDRKVVLLDTQDGRELRRLDRSVSPHLPEQPTWSAVLHHGGERLRLGLVGGMCVDSDGLTQVEPIHRGQASVLRLQALPLSLRLGEEGLFSIERAPGGYVLAADNRERRLWNRPLTGRLVPWITRSGDHLLVIDDQQVRHVSQEGEEITAVALPAPRTAEPVIAGAAGVIVPTTAGLIRLAATMEVLPTSENHSYAACAGDARILVAAINSSLSAWRVDGGVVEVRWAHQVPGDRRLVQVSLTDDRVLAVDDNGVVRVFTRDGEPLRTVRTGATLMAPPLLIAGRLVAVLAPGTVCAY